MSEMLSLVNPLAFGRTSQVQRIAVAIGEELEISTLWDVKIAAMLFPLGCVTVSETALECALSGRPIPEREQAVYAQHAAIAGNMLKQIPRLESVSAIVAYQDKCFDGSGSPQDDVSGNDIPIGARILKVASDFETAYKRTGDTSLALEELHDGVGRYDPTVLKSLRNALRKGLCQSSQREVSKNELTEGMVFASDVRTLSGQLMVTSGQEVTESTRRRLQDLCERGAIEGKFQVEMLGTMESSELVTF